MLYIDIDIHHGDGVQVNKFMYSTEYRIQIYISTFIKILRQSSYLVHYYTRSSLKNKLTSDILKFTVQNIVKAPPSLKFPGQSHVGKFKSYTSVKNRKLAYLKIYWQFSLNWQTNIENMQLSHPILQIGMLWGSKGSHIIPTPYWQLRLKEK